MTLEGKINTMLSMVIAIAAIVIYLNGSLLISIRAANAKSLASIRANGDMGLKKMDSIVGQMRDTLGNMESTVDKMDAALPPNRMTATGRSKSI